MEELSDKATYIFVYTLKIACRGLFKLDPEVMTMTKSETEPWTRFLT